MPESDALDDAVDALAVALTLTPWDDSPDAPLSGDVVLDESELLTVGVWELTSGTAADTEVDELYVILAGRGHIEFLDDGRRVELAPGRIGRLQAGQRTVWHITEAVRKVYLIPR